MDEARDDLARQRARMIDGLRAYGKTYSEVGHRFAASLGLHFTDATAMIEILAAEEHGAPLSPARLGERIGLSAGATSSLLNRLEDAGHIVRSRVHTDRRVVTLHSTPDIQKLTDEFFDPLGVRLDAVMSKYPSEFLGRIEDFITELRSVINDYIDDNLGPDNTAQ